MAFRPGTSQAKLRAQQKWRKNMHDQGFRQVSLWVPSRHVPRIKLFAAKLRERMTARASCRLAFPAAKAKKSRHTQARV